MKLFKFLQAIDPTEKIYIENMDTGEISIATVGNTFGFWTLKEFRHLYIDNKIKIVTIDNETMIKLQIYWQN